MERILAIDDSRSVLRLLATILVKQGYEFVDAEDGAAGLVLCRSFKPDLILLDAEMPMLSGFEVCADLKSHPQTLDIPVIFLSGHDDIAHRVRAFEAGAQDFIAKPFHEREVLLRVDTQLKALKTQRELVQARNAAQQANQAKTVFLSRMSHELRTPLNSILGYARLLVRDEALASDVRERLGIIASSGEHLLGIVNDLIQFAELETGTLVRSELDIDLSAVLQEVLQEFAQSCKRLHVTFVAELQMRPHQVVYLDPSLFRVLVKNLLRAHRCLPIVGHIAFKAVGVRNGSSYQLRLEVQMSGGAVTPVNAPQRDYADESGLEMTLLARIVPVLGGTWVREQVPPNTLLRVDLPLQVREGALAAPPETRSRYDLWVRRDEVRETHPQVLEVVRFQDPVLLEGHLHPGLNRWLIDAEVVLREKIDWKLYAQALPTGTSLEVHALLAHPDSLQELSLYKLGCFCCGSWDDLGAQLAVVPQPPARVPELAELDLGGLPREICLRMRQAAQVLDPVALRECAQSLPAHQGAIAQWIEACCEAYDFAQIENALEVLP